VAGLLVSWRVIWPDLPQGSGLSQALALALSGYLTFLGVLGLLAADRNRRLQAEARLRDWAKLLEQLYQIAPTHQTLSPQSILAEMLEVLQPFFPTLVGMGLRNDFKMRVGQKTDHRYSLSLTPETYSRGDSRVVYSRGEGRDDDAKVTLYFSQPLEDRGNLEALTPLLTERLRQTLALIEWRTQAITDPLTGLLNRRGLERQSRKLIDLARHSGKPITVAMLDLDHFKRVNDSYGHDNGDRVLQALANVLRRHLRAEDLAVRWGGEEFALLLYGAGLKDAHLVLRRIQDELRALRVEPIPWAFTLSAGITGGHVPPSLAVLEDWLLQADWALLQAKDAGRDRVNVVEARKLTDTQAG
jgi:diguanylate cyclase (GGDEF)-like protein